MVTGAIIGSIVPGGGTAIGAAIGTGVDIVANAIMADTVSDLADKASDVLLGQADVNFECPKCGLIWKVPSCQMQMGQTSNISGEAESNSQFFDHWNEYFEKKAFVFSSRITFKKYIDEISNLYDENLDDGNAVSYLFLQSFAILEYRIETDDDHYLKRGNKFLSNAKNILDDEEFQIMQEVYNIYLMDSDSPDALEEITNLPDVLQVDNLDNNYVTLDYWKNAYRNAWMFRALQTGVRLYDNGEQEDAEELLFLAGEKLTEADPPGWEIIVDCYESNYYGENEDYWSEAAYYAKHAVEMVYDSIDIDYDPNDFADRCWLKCLETAGVSYIEGEGEDFDFSKGFLYLSKAADLGSIEAMCDLGDYYLDGEYGFVKDPAKALEWHIKASNGGDSYSAYRIAEIYEEGNGILQDYNRAIQWYKKADELGYNDMYANPTWERIEQIEQMRKNL